MNFSFFALKQNITEKQIRCYLNKKGLIYETLPLRYQRK